MTGTKVSTFRERIAELVNESGQTQTAIAADFGIAKQTISAWVTGQNSPRLPIVYALSYYFNVSIEWLMGFDVDKRIRKREITEDEEAILTAYHSADETAQKYAMEMLLAHPRAKTEENLD